MFVLRQATKLRAGDVLALPFHRTAVVTSDAERRGIRVTYRTAAGPATVGCLRMVPVVIR